MKIRRLFFSGLLLCVLGSVQVQVRAQDPEDNPETNRASLNVIVDKQGAAKVTLTLHVSVTDDELLRRTLSESFSFPMNFKPIEHGEPDTDEQEEDRDEETPDRGWTVVSAETPRAFSHSGLRSDCRINLQSLLPFLRSQHVDYLTVWALFQNAPADIPIEGANRITVFRSEHLDTYDTIIDVRAPALHVINFTMGYSVVDILKRTIPLVAFLLLPSLWTRRSARRFAHRPEELWGRHLRFIGRLLNVIWLIWLPIYSLSGLDVLISFLFGAENADMAQLVNLTFYFVPPIFAMLLCHVASRKVYELVPTIEYSPSDIVFHAITVGTFSLTPLFLLFLGISTFRTSPRQAALYAVIGYVGWLVLSAMSKRFDRQWQSLDPGDLRDRIFELANKAGVVLKDVYLIPEDRAPLSNAYARSDDTIGVTNSVLKNLSRREVDDIMAHEIGHLQARHPHMSRTITLVIIIVANVLGSVLAWTMNLSHSTALVFSGALALASLVKFFLWRRNERQADAIGVTLTGDPEAFISGLAKLSRLSLEPLHSGAWAESLDSHPRTMKRLESIAKSYGISNERLQELIADSKTPAADFYPALETEELEAVAFSYAFKKKYRLRLALVLLGVMLLSPVPFALLFTANSGLLRLLIFVGGVICCFGLFQLLRNKIAFWGHRRLSRQLRTKLEKRELGELACSGTLVGLAPAGESRHFEGYPFWDAGVLWLTNEKLYFVGEQTKFSLEREQFDSSFTQDANPEWLSQKNLFIEWHKAGQQEKEKLHFVVIGERSVWQARRAIDLLQERLECWRYQPADFPSTPPGLGSLEEPAFPEIPSTPTTTEFNPARIFAAAFQLACYGALVGFALRLSVVGLVFVAGVVFAGTFLDELPKYLRKRRVEIVQKYEPANYEPGSWADSNAGGS